MDVNLGKLQELVMEWTELNWTEESVKVWKAFNKYYTVLSYSDVSNSLQPHGL